MLTRRWILSPIIVLVAAGAGLAYFNKLADGVDITRAATDYVRTLDPEQRAKTSLKFDSPRRTEWRFIPVPDGPDAREGLQIKHMNNAQRAAAHRLLRSCLSQSGYDKATKIMELEHVLHVLEGDARRFPRDRHRYYFTLFGDPKSKSRWGLSIEGHHLSLNFVVEGGKVISSSPTFLAANPAKVMNEVKDGPPIGQQVLEHEEALAFELVNSLTEAQRKTAVIAAEAFREIRGPAGPQPPAHEVVGIPFKDLTYDQQTLLKRLVDQYVMNLPKDVQWQRMSAIREHGRDNIRFAWAGALKRGIGHYYRVEGPSFLIEFVNTQPDAAGNPANHIHSVWRDIRGDFGIQRREG